MRTRDVKNRILWSLIGLWTFLLLSFISITHQKKEATLQERGSIRACGTCKAMRKK